VSTNPPKKIHIVTQAYLRAWTNDAGHLTAVDRWGNRVTRAPAAVGYRQHWWSKTHPTLNKTCEDICRPLENTIPRILRSLPASWPLDKRQRSLLGQFLALHIIRTPAWRDWYHSVIDQTLPRVTNGLTPQATEEVIAVAHSDTERARQGFNHIALLATILSSMHWTLLQFDEPVLATSDHPVCPAPLLRPGETVRAAGMPRGGWIETMEVWFPLSPYFALIACWAARPEPTIAIKGTWQHAVTINAVARDQADDHYMHHPERLPAMPSILSNDRTYKCHSIVNTLYPEYDTHAAESSILRSEVRRAVDNLSPRRMALVRAETSRVAA
jgi:hypothetical protein